MHDIDRALFEGQDEEGTWAEAGDMQPGFAREGESPTYEYENDSGESELFADREEPGELWGESTDFGNTELAQASELLSVNNEEELEQFLGNLLSGAVRAAGAFASSPAGKAVGGILKNAARKALPQLGQAVGDYFGPGVGKLGRQAGSLVASKFESGLQLEGLSAEDRELETARAFIRFAKSAAKRTASTPRTISPSAAARQASIAAARQYLPGLLRASALPPARTGTTLDSGRWVRRGSNIIILGAF